MLTNFQRQKICEAAASGGWSKVTLVAWAKEEFNLKKIPAQSTISYTIKKRVGLLSQ